MFEKIEQYLYYMWDAIRSKTIKFLAWCQRQWRKLGPKNYTPELDDPVLKTPKEPIFIAASSLTDAKWIGTKIDTTSGLLQEDPFVSQKDFERAKLCFGCGQFTRSALTCDHYAKVKFPAFGRKGKCKDFK